jgi:crossover junction endodeoxyribonuclease RuvC
VTTPGRLTVLGIDPGLICTGYGLVLSDGTGYRSLGFGAIKPPPQAPRGERLLRIYEELSNVIRQSRPDEVAVEDFITGHVRAAVSIGEARAAALLAAAQAGVAATLYKPLEVKQFVTSYGRGSKEQVQAMVQALLGLEEAPEPHDAADALAVALCHCLRRGSPAGLAPAPSRRGRVRR